MPFSAGCFPVTYTVWEAQVTAGNTGLMVARFPLLTHSFRKGVCSPITRPDKATTSITTVFFINLYFRLPIGFPWRWTGKDPGLCPLAIRPMYRFPLPGDG